MSPDTTPVRVTNRRANFFIIYNSLYDSGLAARIGSDCINLYCYLLRKVNQENQRSWPSQATMSEVTGISERQIRRCLDKLEVVGLIKRDGWKGTTRSIEVFDLQTTANQSAPATVAPDPAIQSPHHGHGGRTPPACMADNKDTVYEDLTTKTQYEDFAAPKNGTAPELTLEPEEPTLNQKIWSGYEFAYRARYRVAPVRNAKVNALVAQLGKRLGEEAVPVAVFYVSHNNRYYVQKCHSVDAMVHDAEKLRTEWASGNTVTESSARQIDRKQGNLNAVQEVLKRQGFA
jgi:DNA-binding Lrp family transcriptional regulator